MIHFLGSSFAANHLREAARKKGLPLTDKIEESTLTFVSEDTPTDEQGNRNLDLIRKLVSHAVRRTRAKPIVLTSQVPVGFTRSLEISDIWHQAETLRIKDAEERANNPEQIIVGCNLPAPFEYLNYLDAFRCPIQWMTWEEAEFSKIAINMTLISQVENTNRLAGYIEGKPWLRWEPIKKVLQTDGRIGPKSYLDPGRWQDSKHLLRDWSTFNE
jgi:UDP-glucose 6-dehydrogenase